MGATPKSRFGLPRALCLLALRSYHTTDRALARRIMGALERAGLGECGVEVRVIGRDVWLTGGAADLAAVAEVTRRLPEVGAIHEIVSEV